MCRFAEICAGISLKVSENLKAYILQAIAANEGTDCRFVLNSKEIERFFRCYMYAHEKVQVGKDQEKAQSEKDSHSKNQGGFISLRAASAYLLTISSPCEPSAQVS